MRRPTVTEALLATLARLPDTTNDPVAFRAHPLMLVRLRARLRAAELLADPWGSAPPAPLFGGLRLYEDLSVEGGLFVPMTRAEEVEWLAELNPPPVDEPPRLEAP